MKNRRNGSLGHPQTMNRFASITLTVTVPRSRASGTVTISVMPALVDLKVHFKYLEAAFVECGI